MPAEERGLAFEDLVVLPNPFPILPGHCTIAARDHRLQQLAGRIDTFLRLTEALGPEMAALYNGPRCGASAPDHLHFQAARAEVIPILGQLPPDLQSLPIAGHESFGRKMAIFTGPDAPTLQSNVERAIDELRRITNSNEEPMLNLLAYCQAGRFTVILFPRAAHRPAFYFATGSDHLAISPAVLEMCGILVATEPEHFDRVDANVARGIYEEVSIPSKLLDRLLAAIATG
jgi:hypothetical protein